MPKLTLLLVILIEGFITISAEILTIRQLLPVVGNSVIVTSLIIGIFLLFLAYGYRRGGQYTTRYVNVLKNNFIIAAMSLGIGLSSTFINLFFHFFQHHISTHTLIILCGYLLLTTAPLVFVLGQTVPITMNLIKQENTIGAIGGKILHLNTIGSFLGAVLTSLLLMNYLGVAWTVFINDFLLLILVLLLFRKEKRDIIRVGSLVIILTLVYQFNVVTEKELFVKTNAYANYRVMNHENNKYLQINNSNSSLITSKNQGFPYIEKIKQILFEDLKLKDKDILVLGAGGFTLSAAGEHHNRFLYLDIDKDIQPVIQQHFLPTIQGKFIASDARDFLNSNQNKFDVIISDVYSNAFTIPTHLLTREYFIQIQHSLRDHGIAILNMVAKPTLEDAYSQGIDNTIRSVFTHCMVIPLQYTSMATNILYVCKNEPSDLQQNANIYLDNLNRTTLDFFSR